MKMKMVQEEMIRKGPWTEQEDSQLVFYVNLFGDRRWDFVAKVSGLKRTGKSCRLRWVNYLHPGLKRCKMTPLEERLVLELHSKWGNRWSRIARKLPGRTDNEIKNYWRTHMRKKAQEKKKTASTSSFSNTTTSSSTTISSKGKSPTIPAVGETKGRSFYDTGGFDGVSAAGKEEEFGAMDEIWRDIELCEDNSVKPIFNGFSVGESYFSCQTMAPPPLPLWNVSLWATEDPFDITISDQFHSFYNQDSSSMLIS